MSEIARAFAYLLTLQLSQQISQGDGKSLHLWSMDCLLDAILVRFRYHFERPESQTNRLAKPEWVFNHMLTQVRAHASFLGNVITRELEKQKKLLDCCDAQVLLLRGLIGAAQRKLRKEVPTLISVRSWSWIACILAVVMC